MSNKESDQKVIKLSLHTNDKQKKVFLDELCEFIQDFIEENPDISMVEIFGSFEYVKLLIELD